MNETVLVVAAIVAATAAFLWLAFSLRRLNLSASSYNNSLDLVKNEVEKIFTDDFREELRNRGRLHFEKIINENAMFLKQDLGLTASQLNEYMQTALKKVLKEELDRYRTSITDANEAALQAIKSTQESIESQRASLQEELQAHVANEKAELTERLDKELSAIANRYILETLADSVDLSAQSEFIFARLEEQKGEIIKDITDAAG